MSYNRENIKFKVISILSLICYVITIIFPRNTVYADTYLNNENLIKNGGFEEINSVWNLSSMNDELKLEYDNLNKYEGNYSLVMNNSSSNTCKGFLLQGLNIENVNGNALEFTHFIQSENFYGVLQLRAKYMDEFGQTIGNVDIKTIDIKPNQIWDKQSYIFEIPGNKDIKSVNIDYVYNNSKGAIWVDNVSCKSINIDNSKKNILKNSSFEEGLSYWNCWGNNDNLIYETDNDCVNDGQKSLLIKNLSDNAVSSGINQNNDATSLINKTLVISQWIKGSNITGNIQLRLKLFDKDGNQLVGSEVKTLNVNTESKWDEQKFQFNIPDDKNIMTFQIEYVFQSFKGEILIDNINIEINDIEQNNNKVKNPGFEEGLSNWNKWGNDNFSSSIDKNEKKEGQSSVLLCNTDNNTTKGAITQIIDINELNGKIIKVKQWVKYNDIEGDVKFRVKFYDNNDQLLSYTDEKIFDIHGTKDWEEHILKLSIPNDENIKKINIEYFFDNVKGKLWIDEISESVEELIIDDNLIKNGEFLEGFSYWNRWSENSKCKIEIDRTIYCNSEKSIKASNKEEGVSRGGIKQEIHIDNIENSSLHIKQLVKTEQFQGNLLLRIKFKDSLGNYIQTDEKIIPINSSQSWTEMSLVCDIEDNNSIEIAELEYVFEKFTGIIWIDDINVEKREKVVSNNIIKNSGFEEGLSYWRKWIDKGEFSADIDSEIKKTGNYSIKLTSDDNKLTRGTIKQTIDIKNGLKGNSLELNFAAKSNNLTGEGIQVRIKYLDQDGNGIDELKKNYYTVELGKNSQWLPQKYSISIPDKYRNYIKGIELEFVYDECIGTIWIDDVLLYEKENKIYDNIIQNGDFEATISNPVDKWKNWNATGDLVVNVDNEEHINGEKSIKIQSNSINNIGNLYQNIEVSEELLGKSIKISQFIKLNLKDYKSIGVTVKYYNSNEQEVETKYYEKINAMNNNEWTKYEIDVQIPKNKDITLISVEYNFKENEGTIWIDNVRIEPFVPIKNIEISPQIIELAIGETTEVNVALEYVSILNDKEGNNNLIITVDNTEIATIDGTRITGIKKGYTLLRIKEAFQNIEMVIPVMVEKSNNISMEESNIIDVFQGEIISKQIQISSDNKNLNYSIIEQPKHGYSELSNTGEITYYSSKNYSGNDNMIILIKDNNDEFLLVTVSFNVVPKNIINVDDIKISMVQGEELVKSKININEKIDDLTYEIKKKPKNGEFIINSKGEFTYKPILNYFGYDTIDIEINGENKESKFITITVYISPNSEEIWSNLVKNNGRIIATNEEFSDIKKYIKTDQRISEWFDLVKLDVDQILNLPVIDYNVDQGTRMDTTSKDYIEKLAFMYRITEDLRYAERAWLELENICSYQNWNNQHFLDTAILSVGAAIGYDWLYEYLNDEQRKLIEESIINKALNIALGHYENNSHFFVNDKTNWNIVCNTGMIVSALSIANKENKDITMKIVTEGLKSLQVVLGEYYNDGSSIEGPMYWEFATEYLMYLDESINTALQIPDHFNDNIDYNKLANYIESVNGTTGSFNYSDSDELLVNGYFSLWLAKKTDRTSLYQYHNFYTKKINQKSIYDLLWYNNELYDDYYSTNQLNRYFEDKEIVTMRSNSYINSASFVAIKGGTTGSSHSDLDLGSFIFDSLGVRWAIDLGVDNYNLPGYFDYEVGGRRWRYYRKRAEGHNTLLIGKSQNEDQTVGATAEVKDIDLYSNEPYVIYDLSEAYSDKAINVERTVELVNNKKDVKITDSFILDNQEEVLWQMHTMADATISEDKKTVTLIQDGQRLNMNLESDCNAVFDIIDAIPFEHSPNPSEQNQNIGIKKVIARATTDKGRISITLRPEGNHEDNSIIKNGDFEDGLSSWDMWKDTEKFEVNIDRENSKSGVNSVVLYNYDEVSSARGTLIKYIDINNSYSRQLKLSQWFKTENFKGDLKIRLRYLDNNAQEIALNELISVNINEEQKWNLFEYDIEVPENTKKIQLEYIYDNSIGRVWIDNVLLQENIFIDKPTWINNGSFENNLVGWNINRIDQDVNIDIDTDNSKEGTKSVKIFNEQKEKSSGILSKTIDVYQLKGSVVKLSEWVKSENFNGELILNISYLNILGANLVENEKIVIDTQSTQDWRFNENTLYIPVDANKMKIEYIYENANGYIGIDDVGLFVDNRDVNKDGEINILDLALTSIQYNREHKKYDFNSDGIVDIYDLIYLSKEIK